MRRPVRKLSPRTTSLCIFILHVILCTLFTFEKKSSAHALEDVNEVAFFISIGKNLQKTEAAIFPVQTMLPKDFPFSYILRAFNVTWTEVKEFSRKSNYQYSETLNVNHTSHLRILPTHFILITLYMYNENL